MVHRLFFSFFFFFLPTHWLTFPASLLSNLLAISPNIYFRRLTLFAWNSHVSRGKLTYSSEPQRSVSCFWLWKTSLQYTLVRYLNCVTYGYILGNVWMGGCMYGYFTNSWALCAGEHMSTAYSTYWTVQKCNLLAFLNSITEFVPEISLLPFCSLFFFSILTQVRMVIVLLKLLLYYCFSFWSPSPKSMGGCKIEC